MRRKHLPKYSKLISLLLIAAISPSFLIPPPKITLAQTPTNLSTSCADITAPLTAEEEVYARTAWQYFVNNYQPETGFTNSVGGYPSGTLWDMGNYLMALNTARQLNLIDQGEFDSRLNLFLTSLGKLELFEDALPNKVYNTATGDMVDYGNNPIDRGIGWSALDIGRVLAAFHVIRTCHPQYADWLEGIVGSWDVARSLQDGKMYGATVLPNGDTLLVQEGRLGYEEYAARGYELWGFAAPKAVSFEPFKFVEINGIEIPVDTRQYQETNANNYVVSESYILDGIEFGFQGDIADYATRILEVQKRRYEQTGQLTAVTEDNIDQAPYFLYNTVFANGVAWATITENNEQHPELRSISTKAAIGWHYLYPENDYGQKLFEAVKDLRSPDGGGFFAGIYEETNQPNKALTGNTNGLILEILYYKARGNRPLIGMNGVSVSTGQPGTREAEVTPTSTNNTPSVIKVSPIPPVDKPLLSSRPTLARSLTKEERRYAEVAWQYFEVNYQSNTGLVNDRHDLNGATLWGMGDYLIALHAAYALEIISYEEFDQRIRHFLGALQQLPLFAGQLPHRGYDTQSLQPIDYGGNPSLEGSKNPTAEGTGWSALDLGRIMAALYNLKNYHPQYTTVVDQIVLDWSYLQVVRDGLLFSGTVKKDENGRLLTVVNQETRLGYEEYAARAFQLWGFNVEGSAVGGDYKTTSVEGFPVTLGREKKAAYLVSNPFLLYGLDFGFDPGMSQLVQPILQVQAQRYQSTGTLTAAATSLIDEPPYIVHSTIIGQGEEWATLTDDGETVPEARIVNTATAFAFHALFPENDYTRQLWEATTDHHNPEQGHYEGFYEQTGKTAKGLSGSTNSIILQSLLYLANNHQPLIRPERETNSPWWQAVAAKNRGQGLPQNVDQTARWIANSKGAYWISAENNTTSASLVSSRQEPENLNCPCSLPTAVQPPKPEAVAIAAPSSNSTKHLLTEADKMAAQQAWQYFERNWNPQTGLVNSVENYSWTTLWDQGSAILGIHAARQLGLIEPERFNSMIERLLLTLEDLPMPATGLPNKAYSTTTAEMRRLDNTPDLNGTSGWSALDTARFLMALHVLRTHYPEYRNQINRLLEDWDISKLEKDGWLYGNIPDTNNPIRLFQEGRLGYEQYAAHSLQLWGIEAENALQNPPVQTIEVEGIPLQVDQRNWENSGATNYLTNDPYLLWGLELGWPDSVKSQVQNLLKVQEERYERTGILTAVNEDSLDRPPYFLYYSVYANGQPWHTVNSGGKTYPQYRFLSTKAAFAWKALMPENSYATTLRTAVEKLAEQNRGYPAGRYENSQLGVNALFNVNTNAVILESLLYQARGGRPLAF
ncbi:MAG: DUF3131 domain-containing protein [Coleofasciculaceae cyanobacterium]